MTNIENAILLAVGIALILSFEAIAWDFDFA
jgi:hypothetical protein